MQVGRKRNKKTIAISILLVCIMIIGSLSAYFTDTETATNVFTIGKVKIELSEPHYPGNDSDEVKGIKPKDIIPKDPTIKLKDGSADSYIYATVSIPTASTNFYNDNGTLDDYKENEPLFTYELNNGWKLLTTVYGNGETTFVYVYSTGNTPTKISAGSSTNPIFNSVQFANVGMESGLSGEIENIVINGYAIQADNTNATTNNDILDIIKDEFPDSNLDNNPNNIPIDGLTIYMDNKPYTNLILEDVKLTSDSSFDLTIDNEYHMSVSIETDAETGDSKFVYGDIYSDKILDDYFSLREGEEELKEYKIIIDGEIFYLYHNDELIATLQKNETNIETYYDNYYSIDRWGDGFGMATTGDFYFRFRIREENGEKKAILEYLSGYRDLTDEKQEEINYMNKLYKSIKESLNPKAVKYMLNLREEDYTLNKSKIKENLTNKQFIFEPASPNFVLGPNSPELSNYSIGIDPENQDLTLYYDGVDMATLSNNNGLNLEDNYYFLSPRIYGEAGPFYFELNGNGEFEYIDIGKDSEELDTYDIKMEEKTLYFYHNDNLIATLSEVENWWNPGKEDNYYYLDDYDENIKEYRGKTGTYAFGFSIDEKNGEQQLYLNYVSLNRDSKEIEEYKIDTTDENLCFYHNNNLIAILSENKDDPETGEPLYEENYYYLDDEVFCGYGKAGSFYIGFSGYKYEDEDEEYSNYSVDLDYLVYHVNDEMVLKDYIGPIGEKVIIPDYVTEIGDKAFYELNIKEIEIPNSVTRIGYEAFYKCKNLKSVTLPNSITNIGSFAFSYSNLTSITIPNSVTNINWGAFTGCKNLKSLTLPNSATNIGAYAFSNCINLESVEIPNEITTIGNNAFVNVSHIYYNGSATGSPWGAKAIN